MTGSKGCAALLSATIAFAAVACGGGDDDNESASAPTAASSQAMVSDRCESATTDVVTPLSNGIERDGVRLTRVYVVKSNDHDSLYFVSAEVDGPGYEQPGDIATFASESRFGGGAIYAVDDLGNELSSLRDGRDVANVTLEDDGVDVSRSCASG